MKIITQSRRPLANHKSGRIIPARTRSFRLILALAWTTVPGLIWGQTDLILPQQKLAIRTLAAQHGFDEAQLHAYVVTTAKRSLDGLSPAQAADLIQCFQSTNPPVPGVRLATVLQPVPANIQKPEIPPLDEPILATVLEEGMSKRFHLLDGNIVLGQIVQLQDGIASIETIDGLLRIPTDVILEETAQILKKDDTRYVGPVLRDTAEEIVLRSSYGDVVVSKRDIKDMDRYYGGRRVPWAEEKRRFYQSEESLTDIFMDPTAFPLAANTFYLSGLSIGYGFTDKFMVRSGFGSDFLGDLNLHPIFQLYHRQTGASEVAAAFGAHLFNHHPVTGVAAKYSNHIVSKANPALTLNESSFSARDVIAQDNSFYWEAYVVLSSRKSLATGRGKMGWHLGMRTNSLAISKPALDPTGGFKWNEKFIPYRIWGAFEYDMSKRMKLLMDVWADNGHSFRDLAATAKDYFQDGTPFVLDSARGEYRPVDFDFGLLYALKDNFRIGLHFQQPYLVFYWEFYEL